MINPLHNESVRKISVLLVFALTALACGCAVQSTRSTGFNPSGITQKKLPPGVPHRVAVFISGNPAIAGQAREAFSTSLLEMGFELVERNRIGQITTELQLSKEGFITPETAIESGRLIGADGFFIGNASGETSATWVDTHLSIRLVETTSGKTIWSVNAHDPRTFGWSMAIETSIIYTTKAAIKALKKDISKMESVSR